MRQSTAVEALVRWLVLAMAGLALLLVLPSDAFGAEPLLWVAGRPATASNLVGLGVLFAAWISFLVRLFTMCHGCLGDRVNRVFFVIFLVTAIGALVASAFSSVAVLVALTVPAVVSQVVLAFRADHLNARRPVRSRRRLAASGS